MNIHRKDELDTRRHKDVKQVTTAQGYVQVTLH